MINKIKLAIISSDDPNWSEDVIHLQNLIFALDNYLDTIDYKVVNITTQVDKNNSNVFNKLKNFADTAIKENRQKNYDYDIELHRQIKSQAFEDYDVVFSLGSVSLPKEKIIISWIPDLQHIHLPYIFSQQEIKWRNKDLSKSGLSANIVLLNSYFAENHFHEYAIQFKDKTKVLHFVSYINPEIYQVNPKEITSIYNLPEKFIYLPNRLFKHKNHESVFKALKALKSKNIKPVIVCSGNTHDYRDLNFFDYLNTRISEYGLHEQIKMLGLIPYDHVEQLIRQSVCVLNPSIYDGWSNNIEKVKSIGKMILLSSIPVHKEQNPQPAEYFDPQDVDDIKDKIKFAWENYSYGPDLELEAKSREHMSARIKEFAKGFEEIVMLSISSTRHK